MQNKASLAHSRWVEGLAIPFLYAMKRCTKMKAAAARCAKRGHAKTVSTSPFHGRLTLGTFVICWRSIQTDNRVDKFVVVMKPFFKICGIDLTKYSMRYEPWKKNLLLYLAFASRRQILFKNYRIKDIEVCTRRRRCGLNLCGVPYATMSTAHSSTYGTTTGARWAIGTPNKTSRSLPATMILNNHL